MKKSYSFVDSFICYKQKCKVVSFNVGHSVQGGPKNSTVYVERLNFVKY